MALFDLNYIDDPAISQSDLKLFEEDIRSFYFYKILGETRPDKRTSAMDKGSLVDAKLLKPEELKRYYPVAAVKAKGKVKTVIDTFVARLELEDNELQVWLDPANLGQIEEFVKEAILALDYQANWTMPKRISDIFEKGREYMEQISAANGRMIIDLRVWNEAMQKVDDLEKDDSTSAFHEALFKSKKGVVVHRQLELRGEYNDEKIKGKLDLGIEDQNTMTFYPWDAKTCKSHGGFMRNYRSLKYGRQGAFYSELCKQMFPKYRIAPFSFLAIPTETREKAEVYEMDAGEMYVHTNGYTFESGYRVKGWQEMVREIQWHKQTGKWDHRKDYYAAGKNMINSKAILDSDLLAIREEEELT